MAEIAPSLPFDQYLARDALSVSKLKAFAKAPALAHVAKEETAAMRMGSLVHCAVLEPGELDRRYVVTDLDRRGTKAWAAEEEAVEGRELVKRADWDDARRMADAVWAHPIARELLEGCDTEVSAFWTDPETGMECKARADAVNTRLGVLLDVKTACDASPREFERAAAKLRYRTQDAHYREGFGFSEFVFIAIEKESLLVACYEFDHMSRVKAEAERRMLMDQYAQCLANNEWPGYPQGITTISTPNWAFQE